MSDIESERNSGMLRLMSRWVGIDVGGKRKGFDAAVVDASRLVTLTTRLSRDAVLKLIEAEAPMLVGIDSPMCWAPDGQFTRVGERLLNKAVCGIRWTPDAHTGGENG
jgi:predicted nuclease with RNAse H fold